MSSLLAGPIASVNAAMMLTPGAVISGCNEKKKVVINIPHRTIKREIRSKADLEDSRLNKIRSSR